MASVKKIVKSKGIGCDGCDGKDWWQNFNNNKYKEKFVILQDIGII